MTASADPTPWATGLLVSTFAAVVTLVAVVAFGVTLAHIHPLLTVGFNLVAVGGAAPTVWRWRNLPVWRWVVYGVAAGVVSGGSHCFSGPSRPRQRSRRNSRANNDRRCGRAACSGRACSARSCSARACSARSLSCARRTASGT